MNINGTGGFEFNPQYAVVSATSVRGFYLSNPFELKDVNASLLPARIVGRFSAGPDVSVAHILNKQCDSSLSIDIVDSFHLCQNIQVYGNCR